MPTFAEVCERPNLAVSWYLMSAYLYYYCDDRVITDYEFDTLAQVILKNWKTITHPHKKLLKLGDLKAGTGYAIKPTQMIINAAQQWKQERG